MTDKPAKKPNLAQRAMAEINKRFTAFRSKPKKVEIKHGKEIIKVMSDDVPETRLLEALAVDEVAELHEMRVQIWQEIEDEILKIIQQTHQKKNIS